MQKAIRLFYYCLDGSVARVVFGVCRTLCRLAAISDGWEHTRVCVCEGGKLVPQDYPGLGTGTVNDGD